jgi:hypothetical protein
MKTFLAITGTIFLLCYFFYKLFWGSKWMLETMRKNKETANEASGKMVDYITFGLLAVSLLCVAIYELFEL